MDSTEADFVGEAPLAEIIPFPGRSQQQGIRGSVRAFLAWWTRPARALVSEETGDGGPLRPLGGGGSPTDGS